MDISLKATYDNELTNNIYFQEKTLVFYNRFHEAVLILLEFFRNDGQGLSGELLITPTYTNMELMFSLHKVCMQ